ncbi:PepSY domain-containing protein [Nocardia transvalensis]|uniref:PepSY domain-containing protein n=1 Tax=Nocardia transvalensis TaxID=37333 RepID=UPI001894A948|nr:PepSY domain-containing protein [Nocardia transvalensis]MBF6328371.1 PepSY domain-containing protein [Nocardia transvalensis]
MAHTIARTGAWRRLSFTAALAAALAGGGSALASAEQPLDQQQTLDAARAALMGATVESVELDTSEGSPKWEIDLRTRDGAGYEAHVDAATGTVLSIEQDND